MQRSTCSEKPTQCPQLMLQGKERDRGLLLTFSVDIQDVKQLVMREIGVHTAAEQLL